MAIGTLSAMVALSPAMRYSTALGQEPTPLKEQNKEQKPPPVKGSEEKEPVRKSEEQQQEGRGKKNEEAPVKSEEKTPGVRSVPKKSDSSAPGKKVDEKKPDEPKVVRGKGESAAVNKTASLPEGRGTNTARPSVKAEATMGKVGVVVPAPKDWHITMKAAAAASHENT